MKTSLPKMRGFGCHGHAANAAAAPAVIRHDELLQAAQDMVDMRDCYESLLSAAAATANCAYEFSEALREYGTCLVHRAPVNANETSGKVLPMLGKAQFELQKLIDNYRVHVLQTITAPSESLLKELETLEEMKRQCDDKRELYENMLAANRGKGRSKHSKSDIFSLEQLKHAQESYQEEATLVMFRLKSLKQGQLRSLLTQAARHHAAQLNFFKKGVQSLEVVEPHVRLAAGQQHIDYHLNELEDDGVQEQSEGSEDIHRGRELSFDYRLDGEFGEVLYSPSNLVEVLGIGSSQGDFSFSERPLPGNHSEPLLPDQSEKKKELNPSPPRKSNSSVLPKPSEIKGLSLTSAGSISPHQLELPGARSAEIWHSSPELRIGVNKLSAPFTSSTEAISKGGMQWALGENLPQHTYNQKSESDSEKMKQDIWKTWSKEEPRSMVPQQSTLQSYRSASPPPVLSPRINEPHELPRPPVNLPNPIRPSITHSAPLVPRGQEGNRPSRGSSNAPRSAAPLPTPPGTMSRSFSIPGRSPRTQVGSVNKLTDFTKNKDYGTANFFPQLMHRLPTPTAQSISQVSNTNGS